MIRGTTPTFTFTIKQDVDLTSAKNIYVTFSQGGSKLFTKTGEDLSVDGKTVSVWLTQEESLALTDRDKAKVQINWTYVSQGSPDIRRAATKVKEIQIDEQLLKKVIE